MSKAHFPHWRYIAFRLAGDRAVSRRAMQNAITGRGRKENVADDDLPRLTRYRWPHGIVRVHHHRLQAARAWLPRITWAVQDGDKTPLRLSTLSASGTIKTLTDRLGILQERGDPRKDGDQGQGRKPHGAGGPRRGDVGQGGRDRRGVPTTGTGPSGPASPPGARRSSDATKTLKRGTSR